MTRILPLLPLMVLLASCCGTGDEKPKLDAGPCVAGTLVEISLATATVSAIRADLTVHGSVSAPPNVVVLRVLLGAGAAEADPNSVSLPIAAMADSSQFRTWHAVIPLGVLLAPLSSVPGTVKIVARPELNCDVSMEAASAKIMVNVPPDAGVDAAKSSM